MKITRKLTQELHSSRAPLTPSPLERSDCAIKKKLSCCDGIGYRLDLSGPWTQAQLCSCVTSCPSCFGRLRHMENGISVSCREPSPSRVVNIINDAGLPMHYGSARLDQFSNFTGNGREVLSFVHKWLAEFNPKSSKGLLIGGPIGVGKTYLIAALLKNLAARGHSVKFVDFFQLLSELKAGYAADKADASILNPLMHVDVLFIDELGKGRNNDWELSILDQMVMGRYNHNKIIVGTTNYGLHPQRRGAVGLNAHLDDSIKSGFNLDTYESLESRVGPRIFSRLIEMSRIVELTGDNVRLGFANAQANLFAPTPGSPTLSPQKPRPSDKGFEI